MLGIRIVKPTASNSDEAWGSFWQVAAQMSRGGRLAIATLSARLQDILDIFLEIQLQAAQHVPGSDTLARSRRNHTTWDHQACCYRVCAKPGAKTMFLSMKSLQTLHYNSNCMSALSEHLGSNPQNNRFPKLQLLFDSVGMTTALKAPGTLISLPAQGGGGGVSGILV